MHALIEAYLNRQSLFQDTVCLEYVTLLSIVVIISLYFFYPAVSSYIIWGRKTCPQVNGTTLLYSGKSSDHINHYVSMKNKTSDMPLVQILRLK